MKIRTNSLFASIVAVGFIGGCATASAPTQLVEARDLYAVSSNGLAAKLSPTELYDAKKALDKANAEFQEHGDTLACRDYSYIAHRKLELVDVKARTELDRQKIAAAVRAGVVVRDTQVKSTQDALASTREQLKEERRDNTTTTKELRDKNTAQSTELQICVARFVTTVGAVARPWCSPSNRDNRDVRSATTIGQDQRPVKTK